MRTDTGLPRHASQTGRQTTEPPDCGGFHACIIVGLQTEAVVLGSPSEIHCPTQLSPLKKGTRHLPWNGPFTGGGTLQRMLLDKLENGQ